jgi:hypothetical protein
MAGLVCFNFAMVGGATGIVISSWFYFAWTSHKFDTSPFFSFPFAGQIYLFKLDRFSFSRISDFFAILPGLIWGFIGALLFSGREVQIKAGKILLMIYLLID